MRGYTARGADDVPTQGCPTWGDDHALTTGGDTATGAAAAVTAAADIAADPACRVAAADAEADAAAVNVTVCLHGSHARATGCDREPRGAHSPRSAVHALLRVKSVNVIASVRDAANEASGAHGANDANGAHGANDACGTYGANGAYGCHNGPNDHAALSASANANAILRSLRLYSQALHASSTWRRARRARPWEHGTGPRI